MDENDRDELIQNDGNAGIHDKNEFHHFHCYLLRSEDPSHRYKTYIGFTTNPYRRLRQHNGELKHGGARRTKRSGRPWKFVTIIGGFTDRILALQFEWAWQHPHKSRHVKKALASLSNGSHSSSDDENKVANRNDDNGHLNSSPKTSNQSMQKRRNNATPTPELLYRRRGVNARLDILRILLCECTCFQNSALILYFFDNQWKTSFMDLCHKSGSKLSSSMEYKLINTVSNMPFWNQGKERKKSKGHTPSVTNPSGNIFTTSATKASTVADGLDTDDACNNEIDLSSQKKKKIKCFICSVKFKINDAPIICPNCSISFHVRCLADYLLDSTNAPSTCLIPTQGSCPMCETEIVWSKAMAYRRNHMTSKSLLSSSLQNNDASKSLYSSPSSSKKSLISLSTISNNQMNYSERESSNIDSIPIHNMSLDGTYTKTRNQFDHDCSVIVLSDGSFSSKEANHHCDDNNHEGNDHDDGHDIDIANSSKSIHNNSQTSKIRNTLSQCDTYNRNDNHFELDSISFHSTSLSENKEPCTNSTSHGNNHYTPQNYNYFVTDVDNESIANHLSSLDDSSSSSSSSFSDYFQRTKDKQNPHISSTTSFNTSFTSKSRMPQRMEPTNDIDSSIQSEDFRDTQNKPIFEILDTSQSNRSHHSALEKTKHLDCSSIIVLSDDEISSVSSDDENHLHDNGMHNMHKSIIAEDSASDISYSTMEDMKNTTEQTTQKSILCIDLSQSFEL